MSLHKITFSQEIDECTTYLYQHDDEIVKWLEENKIEDRKILLSLEEDFREDFPPRHSIFLTDSLRDFILENRERYADSIGATLYLDCTLEEVSDYPEEGTPRDWEHEEYEDIDFFTEDQFRSYFFEICDALEDTTPEEQEEVESFLDVVDNFMAKGRHSQRKDERGEKYLKTFEKKDL